MRWESNNFGVQNKKNHSIRAGKISEILENIPTYELGYFHRIRFEKTITYFTISDNSYCK